MARAPAALLKRIVDTYKNQRSDFEQLQGHIEASLRKLKATCPEIHSYSSRIKDPASLRHKLERRWESLTVRRKQFDVTPDNVVRKINDLVGGRILHLHINQFPMIDQAIRNVFDKMGCRILNGGPEAKVWDPEYKRLFSNLGIRCVSKLSLYTSVHYEYEMPGRKPRLTCELQVRTLAEELWGATDHLINYPRPCKLEACREQILVLARATSTCTRLVDSIMKAYAADEAK